MTGNEERRPAAAKALDVPAAQAADTAPPRGDARTGLCDLRPLGRTRATTPEWRSSPRVGRKAAPSGRGRSSDLWTGAGALAYWPSLPGIDLMPVRLTAFVSNYRCGAVPDCRRAGALGRACLDECSPASLLIQSLHLHEEMEPRRAHHSGEARNRQAAQPPDGSGKDRRRLSPTSPRASVLRGCGSRLRAAARPLRAGCARPRRPADAPAPLRPRA